VRPLAPSSDALRAGMVLIGHEGGGCALVTILVLVGVLMGHEGGGCALVTIWFLVGVLIGHQAGASGLVTV